MCEIEEKSTSRHPDSAIIRALAEGLLPPADSLPLLEHLEACPACMDAYIAALEDSDLEEMTGDVAMQVLKAVEQKPQQEERKTIAVFLPAAIKLLAAVTLTMVLFFTGVFDAMGSGASELVNRIGASAAAPEEEPSGFAQWSEALDNGIRGLMEQWNTLFKRS